MRNAKDNVKTYAIRHIRLPILGILTLAFFQSLEVAGAAEARKPNILIILSDDQSYPHLGCLGEPELKTPNLDAIATGGMKFHGLFVTSPQCSPSRCSLMTGRSPVATRTSRFGAPLPRGEITFPEILRRDAGYYTGILGRIHHLDGTPHSPGEINFLREHPEMQTAKSRFDYVDASTQDHIPARMKEFFDQQPAGKPYFLEVNLNDPHLPWDTGTNPPDSTKIGVPPYLPDTPVMRKDLSRYMGECEHADSLVKEILGIVNARAGLANTLIMYLADNGYAVPHGKCSLYDPGLHVPLLVNWKDVVKPGAESSALISGEDIAPTCLEAAGVKPPAQMTGVSFLPLLCGQPFPQQRQYVFGFRSPHTVSPYDADDVSELVDFSRCVRDARYKLIMNVTPERVYAPAFQNYQMVGTAHWKEMVEAHRKHTLSEPFERMYFGPRPGYELYDLQTDPNERTNLYHDTKLQPVVKRLSRALREKMGTEYDYLPLP